MCETVQILMSVYNGENYIREQLDSIVAQTYPQLKLLIRDDGSTDATMEIVREYQQKYDWIETYSGANRGAAGSFFELIEKADEQAGYFAFSDQDDVWKPDKIERAVAMLQKVPDKKALYCSPTQLVDKQLQPLQASETYTSYTPSFGNAVVECIYAGCTAVFTHDLWEMTRGRIPKHAYMHDWWLYLMATAFGSVCYDTESRILYRQHGNNTVGGQEGFIGHLKRRIRNYGNMKHYVPEQLREFRELYEENLTDEQRAILAVMTMEQRNPFTRSRIFREKAIVRNRKLDNWIYKLMFLFWRIRKC